MQVVTKSRVSMASSSYKASYGTSYSSGTYVSNNAYGTTVSYSNAPTTTITTAVGDDNNVYYMPAASVPTSYVPSYGASSDQIKVSCTKCGNSCDYGQDYCDKCGESMKDEASYEGYFDAGN